MTKAVTLKDICPEDGEFTLSDTGKTYTVRKFTLRDHAWLSENFGGTDAVAAAFQSPLSMLRIAFHQMPVEQQKEFTPQPFEVMDEDTGEVRTERVGGWRLFAQSIPNNGADIVGIAEALTRALVGSAPLLDDEAQAESTGNPGDVSKKNMGTRIGGKSSTSSPRSTESALI